jgi:hypothetical protein
VAYFSTDQLPSASTSSDGKGRGGGVDASTHGPVGDFQRFHDPSGCWDHQIPRMRLGFSMLSSLPGLSVEFGARTLEFMHVTDDGAGRAKGRAVS